MQNTFPILLSLTRLAPFILRISITIFILYSNTTSQKIAKRENSKTNWFQTIVEIVLSIFILVGMFTQVTSIILTIFMIIRIFSKDTKISKTSYALSIPILLSLVISGAGFFAFDLPF